MTFEYLKTIIEIKNIKNGNLTLCKNFVQLDDV